MKTNYLLAGNLIRLLLLIGGLWLTVGNMWGYSHYAQLTATPESGKGKVYVAHEETVLEDRTYKDSSVDKYDAGSGADATFYIYATPAHGYVFREWQIDDSKTHTIAAPSSAETTDIVKASTTDDGTESYAIKAYFDTNTQYVTVTYLAAINGGESKYDVYCNLPNYPSVTLSKTERVYNNEQVGFNAIIKRGYRFVRYYQTINGVTTTLSKTTPWYGAISQDCEIGMECESKTPFAVRFVTAENGTYTVSVKDENNDNPDVSSAIGGEAVSLYAEDAVTLTATPASGYVLYRWIGKDSDGITYTLGTTMTSPVTISIPTYICEISAEFMENTEFSVQYIAAENGTYTLTSKTDGYAPTIGGEAVSTYPAYKIQLSAPTPESGYIFYRWYVEDENGLRSTLGTTMTSTLTTQLPTYVRKVGAEFKQLQPYLVGDAMYGTFEEALQAVGNSGTIVVMQDATIPAGYYTIPAGVTLLVPYKDGQYTVDAHPIRVYNKYTSPTAYRKLTLATGVHFDVWGKIHAGGQQSAKGQDDGYNGMPHVAYGWIYLNEGSTITLEDGSDLSAWGYITGSGEIEAKRGATVRESLQIKDWRGGTATLLWSSKAFPFNQFYIQNIESAITFRPGSKELVDGTVNASSKEQTFNDVAFIGINGSSSLFMMANEDMSEDTWVRKKYDAVNDKQVYELNSSANIGSITVYGMSSSSYILPLPNNMHIHLLTGSMQITQNTELLPGAEIEIDKEATAYINADVSLYIFDIDEWVPFTGTTHTYRLPYSPSWAGSGKTCPRSATITEDASLNIHGKMVVNGSLYTTAGGAKISSTNEDAGIIVYNNTAPSSSTTVPVNNTTTASNTTQQTANTAWLLNADDSYATTARTPAGQSYCYMNGKWTMMTVDTDNSCFVYDNYGNYYAKPGEYVMINAAKTAGVFSGNADHTYSDAAGTGRLFILMDDCQWWEVELDNNLYHGIGSNSDKYYAYNETTSKWEEKKFTIRWQDYDGVTLATYYLTAGTTAKYLSSNPTRPDDIDYTYSFTGWTPTPATVTGDATYTATYQATAKRYTIIFQNENGSEMERQLLPRNTMPTPPDVSAIANAYWQPAVSLVTGNQIYVLAHYDETPTDYTITFNNYDGTRLQRSPVTADETPVYTGETPSRPSTTEYVYTFLGWSVDGSTVLAELPAATAAATYTALFTASARPYSIRFFQEDGTTQIGETQTVTYGSMPEVPAYSKTDPEAGHIYTLVWQPSVQTVTADADYTASFTDEVQRFSVTAVGANCSFTGSGVYDYCATPTHALIAIPNEGYEFVEWRNEKDSVLATTDAMWVDVTANRTYTAVVRSAAMEVGLYESKTFSRPTTITDLVINASEEQSSDLNGLENLTVTRDAYFIYSFKATRFNRQTQNWYAFGVPFKVNAQNGISANGRQLVLGRDIDIVYYDGQTRANNGADNSAWTYVEDQSSKVLQPGVLYLAAFAADYDKVQFLKQREADLNNATAAKVHTYASANSGDANWNGIANPALYRAYLNAGTLDGQIYRSIDGSWQPAHLSQDTFTIGRPVFVQVQKPQSVVVSRPAASPAPLRRQAVAATSDRFDLQLLTPQGKTADRIFVIANEDAADAYTIGEDIAKAGVSTRVAQMWIDRYGARLCKNTIAATDNAALYSLTLTAPAAGSYTLQATAQSGDARLYLTYMGEVIADLSANNYTIDLVKGTNSGYGLRLVTTRRDVVTDLDEVLGPNSTSDNEAGTEQTRKCIYRNQLYLIRGGQVYDAQGQRVQ